AQYEFLGFRCKSPRRVLYCNRDNLDSDFRVFLDKWKHRVSSNFKIYSRLEQKECPPLTDLRAWNQFPVEDYDVIFFDGWETFTEDLGDKDDKKFKQILAMLIDLKKRGPAMVMLDNTLKDESSYKGRAEKIGRADIFYELRDLTGV